MEPTSKFIPFEELDPDAARRLPPGTRLRVSRRTFAEIATERARELRALSDGSSEAKSPANSKFVALEELDVDFHAILTHRFHPILTHPGSSREGSGCG